MKEVRKTALVNKHGKRFDGLDAVMLSVWGRQCVGHDHFSVYSSDGWPMVGFVPDATVEPLVILLATEWTLMPDEPCQLPQEWKLSMEGMKS